jgi:hypothetical protein
MKILSVGDELFYVDGQTDMTKLIVDFRNFANAPKNSCLYRELKCASSVVQSAST